MNTKDSGVEILVKMCEEGIKNGTISGEMKKWYDDYLSEKKKEEKERKEKDESIKREDTMLARRDKYHDFGYNTYFNSVWFHPSGNLDDEEVMVLSGPNMTDTTFSNRKSFKEWNVKFIRGEVTDENIHVISKLEGRKRWLRHIGLYDAAMKIPDAERFMMIASYYDSPSERDSFFNGWRYGVIDLLTGSGMYPGGVGKTRLFNQCERIFLANDNKDDEQRFVEINNDFNFFHIDRYKFITIPFEHFKNGTYDEFVRNAKQNDEHDVFFHHSELMKKYGFEPLKKPE